MANIKLACHSRLLLIAALFACSWNKCLGQTAPLQITFGAHGIRTVVFQGTSLEDTDRYPSDNFHIWHMKMTDLKGKAVSSGQNGWGENSSSKIWDAGSRTWTYSFAWGSIQVKFEPSVDSLGIEVTEINKADSGVILDGASIYPFGLHFPALPKAFTKASYPQLNDGVSGPGVLGADYGSGVVAIVTPQVEKPFYSGLVPEASANSYSVVISGSDPPGLAVFAPHHDRPVRPGDTDHLRINVDFAPAGTQLSKLGAKVYANWAKAFPATLHWRDRRIIGTIYLASSPSGDQRKPHGYANNPRRYFKDERGEDFDIRNAGGVKKLQTRVLAQAAAIVDNLKRLNAQGAITWDIEGEEYPQQTSYVCSPDQVAMLAPEMEQAVEDRGSKYAGMKLDDAYFKTIRDAGFRVGVCVRPQHFSKEADGSAQQMFLPADKIADELIRKMKYAHDRWGATLFYLDSTVDKDGAVIDAGILKKAAAALPDSLLIPEESDTRSYAYAAPFQNFLFHGSKGTDAVVQAIYPRAFSAVLVNDVDAKKLADARGDLINAVKHGDVLMVHADYWQANNDTVMDIYSAAQRLHEQQH